MSVLNTKLRDMNNSKTNSKLNELLEGLTFEDSTYLIRLSVRDGHNYLIDKIVSKVMNKRKSSIQYKKMGPKLSAEIMQELQINKNPVLLYIKAGKIQAIFTGIIGQHQLEKTIEENHLHLGPSAKTDTSI